jgi:hypothetical protein
VLRNCIPNSLDGGAVLLKVYIVPERVVVSGDPWFRVGFETGADSSNEQHATASMRNDCVPRGMGCRAVCHSGVSRWLPEAKRGLLARLRLWFEGGTCGIGASGGEEMGS